MPSSHWAGAYLERAAEDLEAAKAVAEAGAAPSTLCMLLQMTFEKLTKAALLDGGHWPVSKATNTHKTVNSNAASVFLDQLKRQQKLLGLHHDWGLLRLKVKELEDHHPQLREGTHLEQLEYPWQRTDGRICSPARHLRIAHEIADPCNTWGERLLNLATNLISRFDEIV